MSKILIINPGSTSTKIAVFEDEMPIIDKTIRHDNSTLEKFILIIDQYEFRKNSIIEFLKEEKFDINSLDIIMARGGLIKPIPSGVYEVNDTMIYDLKNSKKHHASNLAALIGKEIANSIKKKCYIADPVVVDELEDIARISGHSEFPKVSIFHALNQKAMARKYSKEIGKNYEDLNLIVAHLGGGISVGIHKKGRVIDVNNALDGDGPFSPERSGNLPVGAIIRACFDGTHSEKEMMEKLVGKGGWISYLGTNDGLEAEKRALSGDEKAILVLDATAYQIAKEIGAMATVVEGKVDAVIITGGVARSKYIMNKLLPRISFISKVIVYPSEDELLALAQNGIAVLKDSSYAKEYK